MDFEVVAHMDTRRYYLVTAKNKKRALKEAERLFNEEFERISEFLLHEWGIILDESVKLDVVHQENEIEG
jgi:HD-like signal output (HDOD) protein